MTDMMTFLECTQLPKAATIKRSAEEGNNNCESCRGSRSRAKATTRSHLSPSFMWARPSTANKLFDSSKGSNSSANKRRLAIVEGDRGIRPFRKLARGSEHALEPLGERFVLTPQFRRQALAELLEKLARVFELCDPVVGVHVQQGFHGAAGNV